MVLPVEGHTKLAIQQEGLEALRHIKGPVVPLVVIGPYRSGKSFLLNQLLGVGCGEGFGVGHTRNTQTKGVWLWGQPQAVSLPSEQPGSPPQQASLVFIDTEGFYSTGKSDAYDDRIFALSTLISSVLVYNLPETVRESDVEKLSFSVELADALFSSSQGDKAAPVEPANMLWLIQRDFLEGKTVQAMVREALAPQDNALNDPDIAQVNKIRKSLQVIAGNSTAFGLRQPHLERTRLCELNDSQLETAYVRQRDELKLLVQRMAKPKRINGQVMDGAALAKLIERMVGALNSRDIPTAGSILEGFNKDLVYTVRDKYMHTMEALRLPVDETALSSQHDEAAASAWRQFDTEKFGNDLSSGTASLRAMLQAAIDKEFMSVKTLNTLESNKRCEVQEVACEDMLEREQQVHLPSTGRFEDRYNRCRTTFNTLCIGPAYSSQAERLNKAWRREHARFTHDYNDKLFNGLVLLLLVDILVFRFVIKSSLLETVGWILFVFLQVYPKLYLSGGSMYEAAWWGILVKVWEALVYNPVLDLEQWWQILLPVSIVSFLGWKVWSRWLHGWWKRRRDKQQLKRLRRPHSGNHRDLNV